ncbi:hypothetical protein QQ045_023932 [Rhodiola kirilowii]
MGVNIWYASDQVIVCEVVWNGKQAMVGFVYAQNNQRDRRRLWDDISNALPRAPGPWLILGDFNCIRSQEEKLNGVAVREAETMELSEFLDQTGLFDLSSSGNFYTWSDKHQHGRRIWCKLDRIICNDSFLAEFPNVHGIFPEPGISDHSPAICRLAISSPVKKWFRFQSFWAATNQFSECMAHKWIRGASNLFLLQKKLKSLKRDLIFAMKDFRGDMNIRVDQGRQSLLEIQRSLMLNPNNEEWIRKEVLDLLNFRKLLRYQHIFNCQRARLNWAKEGDLNTKYFHAIIKGRRAKNTIRCVQTTDGEFLFDNIAIKEHFVNFFKNLFNGSFNASAVDPNVILKGSKVLTVITWNFLKPLGVCGDDIVRSINAFFRNGIMPDGINSAYLALIPKVNNASMPADFRPISCCNVLYKIVSTLLANRLKPVLDYLVDQSQAAFVKGRNIANNISLVQELLCKYNRKHLSKRCMLKIDITKAYDMVDWSFLKTILGLFGFPSIFVQWIMACVSSAHFSVLINGSLEGYFKSNRGIRQGDPSSPYLFTLVMEVLSRILGQCRQSNEFVFHPKCARISLSHLMFADDIIIFSKADLGSLMKIKEALSLFHSWSGLEVNGNKSAIYFGGCGDEDQAMFSMAVGINSGQLPFSYLGVLLDGRSLRRSAYDGIIDKMTAKIKSWTNRCLSYAGRLVLVKYVLCSICSYWMRVLLFPKFVLKKVTAICRNFLWSGVISGKKNLVAWKSVSKPKEEGGMAKGAYELMVESEDKVNWNNLVWNGVAHPKHSFCTWLAIQKRLYTRDRIWGLEEEQRICSCCNLELESVDHIFFNCRGLNPINMYLEMVGIHVIWNKWEDVMQWQHTKSWRSQAEKSAVFFIITLATYETWKARNHKIFRDEAANKHHLWSLILKIIRMKMEIIKNTKIGSCLL